MKASTLHDTARRTGTARLTPLYPFLQAQLCRDLHSEAQAAQCDVCNDAQQSAVFDQHVKAFGSLDLAVLNAGIAELGGCQGRPLQDGFTASETRQVHSSKAQHLCFHMPAPSLATCAYKLRLQTSKAQIWCTEGNDPNKTLRLQGICSKMIAGSRPWMLTFAQP